jgi:Na+/H+-translocating membrane pyrophosphatase
LFKYCSPVQDVADSCRTGAATNVIFGLALGYKSVIIPIFSIAIAIYVSFSLAAMYGISVAALGMLSTIATGLAIDAYGPISDNAGGLAEMAGMSHEIRERTDALDAAGNTTAAIGKVIFFFFFLVVHFSLLTKCCVITSTLGFSTTPASTLRSQVNLY